MQSSRSRRAGCWLLPPLSSASTALLPPPAFCECRHCRLARRGIAMPWRPVLTLPEGYCPRPRRTYRRRMKLHDTADDEALDIRPSHLKGTHHVTALGTMPPAIACEIVTMDSRVVQHWIKASAGRQTPTRKYRMSSNPTKANVTTPPGGGAQRRELAPADFSRQASA